MLPELIRVKVRVIMCYPNYLWLGQGQQMLIELLRVC